jgi:hypothetical protein
MTIGEASQHEKGLSLPRAAEGFPFEEVVFPLVVDGHGRVRDLEELMMERGLQVGHSSIGRWVLRYAPELNKRVRRELRPPNRSWRVEEPTFALHTGETIDSMLSPKRDAVAAKQPYDSSQITVAVGALKRLVAKSWYLVTS